MKKDRAEKEEEREVEDIDLMGAGKKEYRGIYKVRAEGKHKDFSLFPLYRSDVSKHNKQSFA